MYKIFIVGIGGIGMSGIAEILYSQGYNVSGSDLTFNANVKKLQDKFNMKINIGHNASNIEDFQPDLVVFSSAIKDNNSEYIYSKSNNIPTMKRHEILNLISKEFKNVISISGSHGKTTTTSLTAELFSYANKEPTVLCGGIINSKKTNAYLGKNEFLILEADESDATFIKFISDIVIVTNIEHEHVDYYNDFKDLINDFTQYIIQARKFAILYKDDKNIQNIISSLESKEKIITYSLEDKTADFVIQNIRYGEKGCLFDLSINLKNYKIKFIKDIQTTLLGFHNILNITGSIVAGIVNNIDIDIIKDFVSKFEGVSRRLTKVGEINNITVIDDYAHHPTEIKMSINAIKNNNARVIVVLQPHRYSRLEAFFEEYISSLEYADYVYVSEVYSAGESAINGFDNVNLVSRLKEKNNNSFVFDSNKDNLVNIMKNKLQKNDIIIFMGAGTVTNWAYNFYEQLKNELK